MMTKCLVFAAVLSTLSVAQVGQASLMIEIEDNNGNSASVFEPTNNLVNFSFGSIGPDWDAQATGFGELVLNQGEIDLLSLQTSGGEAGSISITLIQTDMLGTYEGFNFSIGGTTQGTVDVAFYTSDANANTIGDMDLLGSDTGLTGPFFGTGGRGLAFVSDPFSLGIQIDITHDGSGTTSFDAFMTPVPEPGTMALLGLGLIGLTQARRKTPA